MTRTVIRGGSVVDGTGAPARRADVAVEGGRVVEVAEGLGGDRELDASGRVVAPGFIDIHTHYDAQVFWDPGLTPSRWHGVTSVVAGNCGFSIAPCRPEHHDLVARTLEHVEDMPLETLRSGIPWDFASFPEYLRSVERHRPLLNFGAYVGHTATRLWVMGDEGYEREAGDEEIAEMARVVGEALEAGAVGFSTSASPTHAGAGGRPVPSRRAAPAEIEALLGVPGKVGRGVAAIVAGEGVTYEDLYDMVDGLGAPVTWTALLTIGRSDWHESMAARNRDARARGADIWPQVSCRPLAFQFTMAEPFTFQVVPAFAEVLALPEEQRLERYADDAWRRRAGEELAGSPIFRPRWDAVLVAESRSRPDLVGRSVASIAEERGCAPLDAVLDTALDDRLGSRFQQVIANDDPDGIAWLLQQEGLLLGLSDAGAHIGQLCDACMPTDLLGNWVRERGVLSLEAGIRKLTGEPAEVFGMEDRGRLAPGAAADVVVLDPETVAPGPLRRVHDLPGGAGRLVADRPEGIAHVLVNGEAVRVDGEDREPEARPGRLLTGRRL